MPSTNGQTAVAGRPQVVDEHRLVEALRDGNERAFADLVDRHGATMQRVARGFVASDTAAEEVVQETWLAVLAGLDRFEARSSLRTWIFQILINRAKTQGTRDRRTVPLSALDAGQEGPIESLDRVARPVAGRPGRCSTPPRPWQYPERRTLSLEARERLRRALSGLPERQQIVVTLRDVEGMSSADVCRLLDVSPENQRVLLHRGRTQLRGVLAAYVKDWGVAPA